MSLEKKIYREWAFTGNESEKASINREIYKELCEKYKISRYEVENPDDYDIVLKERPDIIIQPMQSLRITQICRSWSLP